MGPCTPPVRTSSCSSLQTTRVCSAVIYGNGDRGVDLAIEVALSWSRSVCIVTDGPVEPVELKKIAVLNHLRIPVVANRVLKFEGDPSTRRLHRIVFGGELDNTASQLLQNWCVSQLNAAAVQLPADSQSDLSNAFALEADVVYVNIGREQQSALPQGIGCTFTDRNNVSVGRHGRTCVDGIFVVGNASNDSLMFVVTAAANGTKAGFELHSDMLKEELEEMMGACLDWTPLRRLVDRKEARSNSASCANGSA